MTICILKQAGAEQGHTQGRILNFNQFFSPLNQNLLRYFFWDFPDNNANPLAKPIGVFTTGPSVAIS